MTPNEIASLGKRIARLEANQPERAVPDPIPNWMEAHLVEVLEILDDIAESQGGDDVPDGWSEPRSPYAWLGMVAMLADWHRRYCQTFEEALEVTREATLHSGPCQPTARMLARLWPHNDPSRHDDWRLGLNTPPVRHDEFRVEPDWITLTFWHRELERRRTPSLSPENPNAVR